MRRIRTFIRIFVVLVAGLFLHYVLPQQDVARVVSTEVIRTDFSAVNRMFYAQADAGATDLGSRDLRLINAVRKRTFLFGLIRGGDRTMVYRNEDTGWIYPPYFKFDSANLQTEAQDLQSSPSDPQWTIITHYGWRIPFMSIYPNAVSVRPVDGPDYRPVPWINIILLIGLVAAGFFVRAMWRQLRERTYEPFRDSVGDSVDRAEARLAERRGRLRRWLDSWRSKDRR